MFELALGLVNNLMNLNKMEAGSPGEQPVLVKLED
jgi:hypothetical protein